VGGTVKDSLHLAYPLKRDISIAFQDLVYFALLTLFGCHGMLNMALNVGLEELHYLYK
jgi:hypothetical protein